MSREVKRVALDFDWPLGKVWEGFIEPERSSRKQCETCKGSGASWSANFLTNQWYGNAEFDPEETDSIPFSPEDPLIQEKATRNAAFSYGVTCSCGIELTKENFNQHTIDHPEWKIEPHWSVQREAQRLANLFNCRWQHHLNKYDVQALIDADRLSDFTHWPRVGTPVDAERHKNGWLKESNGYIPTSEEVNRWSLSFFGHDSLNCWVCVKAKCKRIGVESTCFTCEGHGEIWGDPAEKLESENWERTQPPTGEGYQLWETVSEGSPISPVFAIREEFINWLVEDGGRDGPHSRTAAENFVENEWAPSAVFDQNGLRSGVDVYDK